MNYRTDLALERREMAGSGDIDGVKVTEAENGSTKTLTIDIYNGNGAKALSKPAGRYITVETDGFPDAYSLCGDKLEAVVNALKELVPKHGSVLVAGLGNTGITPDALGPQCASMILATRHLSGELKNELQLTQLRDVCAVTPGVTGRTGIEATEIIASVCEKIKPSVVITVDALAAKSISRVGKTVQLSNTGIEPGSGVGNSRKALNAKNLGVPVIAIGVPTVVDALSLARDVAGEVAPQESEADKYNTMMVTPRDIDVLTQSAAKLLALALNCVLQPSLEAEELLSHRWLKRQLQKRSENF